MTEVLNSLNICANDRSSASKSLPTSPSNTVRRHIKQSPLSRDEIMSILQGLVIEGPLVEYMVAHGVVSSSSARELTQGDCKNEQKIEKLLDLLDSECDTPQHYSQNAKLVLLTNALRNTGQHALASQLDRGRKIKPAPLAPTKLSDTGYGSDINLELMYHPNQKVQFPIGYRDLAIFIIIAGAAADSSSPSFRRRGQLNLWVQVAAIRLSHASYQQFHPPPPSLLQTHTSRSPLSSQPRSKKRPLSSESPSCCEAETGGAVKGLLETSKGAYFWIDLKGASIPSAEPTNPAATAAPCVTSKPVPKVSAISRLLSCLCCTAKRRKSPDAKARSPIDSVDCRLPSFVCPLPSHSTSQESSPDDFEMRSREQALRLAKLAILDAKSNDFYSALASPLSDALVKFLEQTLGVLVLGARVESHCPNDCLPEGSLQPLSASMAVSIVATTHEVLERLHDAITLTPQENLPHLPPASSLSSALETILQQETDFMEKIDVKDIRLSVALQADEMRLAASELEE
ncbi:unnamed protein product [Taenia asiatica]|uniref:CARD domain-containing protein n=1 Tax=Taenia asiatica TaxID=60517 RepID=A0A0R3W8T4_TAEAS|nr:unnamed protein product [Taenia asiatica]